MAEFEKELARPIGPFFPFVLSSLADEEPILVIPQLQLPDLLRSWVQQVGRAWTSDLALYVMYSLDKAVEDALDGWLSN